MSGLGPLEQLFADWLDAACYVIGDTSGDFRRDYAALLEDAKRRALLLGIKDPRRFFLVFECYFNPEEL